MQCGQPRAAVWGGGRPARCGRRADRRGARCRAAAVTLRSPRRLRRSPEDAPLRPAGALVSRTSPADGRITDPRVSNCWSPMRSAASGTTRREGRAAGAGPGRLASSTGGTRHGPDGAAGTPGALDVPPRGRPDTNAGLCAAVRARAPRLSRRIPARRCRCTAGGTPGPESSGVRAGGRARFRSLPRSVRRVVSLDGLRLRITDPRGSVIAGWLSLARVACDRL